MTHEKRGLMGRNTSPSKAMFRDNKSSRGTSNSSTARIDIDSAELFMYCDIGLTGSEPPPVPFAIASDIVRTKCSKRKAKDSSSSPSLEFSSRVRLWTAPRKWRAYSVCVCIYHNKFVYLMGKHSVCNK